MKNKTWLKVLCNLDLFIASAALIVLVLITAGGVFMRYVLKDPILWQEEIQAFCQVWMVYIGASVAFRCGSVVAIEMVVDIMPPKMRRVTEYFIDAVVLFVLGFLMVKSQAYITQVFGKSGRPTPILRIPYSIIYGIAPYGCGLMMISYLLSKYLPGFVKKMDIDVSSDTTEDIDVEKTIGIEAAAEPQNNGASESGDSVQ